jgi:hypothetical protein
MELAIILTFILLGMGAVIGLHFLIEWAICNYSSTPTAQPQQQLLTYAEIKGVYGENLTCNELRSAKMQDPGIILRNLYVPHSNGFTEVDIVMLNHSKIFVIESKNYEGWIFGRENDKYWTQTFKSKRTKFYNPIRQNQTHIKALSTYLGIREEFFVSIIVFSNSAKLQKIPANTHNRFVINRAYLAESCNSVHFNSKQTANDEDVTNVYLKLEPLTRADDSIKNIHAQSVQRYQQSA